MMRMVSDLLSLSRIDNDSSHLDVELTNFTAFITFILNRFDKIKSQDETKKYEICLLYTSLYEISAENFGRRVYEFYLDLGISKDFQNEIRPRCV